MSNIVYKVFRRIREVWLQRGRLLQTVNNLLSELEFQYLIKPSWKEMIEEGEYINLEPTEYGLKFILTEEGRERIEELNDRGWNDIHILADLMEDHLGNNWEFLSPEDLGALTDAEILTDCAVYDDDGELISVDYVYYDEHYQIRSTVHALYYEGVVEWKKEG